MDSKLPFTTFDFWAYLSAGFLLIFVADYVAGTGLLSRESWPIVQAVVAVSVAYVVGQLVASISAIFYERLIVGKVLGYPRDVLFGKAKASTLIQRAMPEYFRPLPEKVQLAALRKASEFGEDEPGERLFWAAYSHARDLPAVMAKVDTFLTQYNFCRNIALVALLDSAILFWSHFFRAAPQENLNYAWLALIVGIGMSFRYLKYFRLFSVEIYVSYAHAKVAGKGQD